MGIPRGPAPISTPISDTDQRGRLTGYVPVPWSDYFNGVDLQLSQSYLVLAHQQAAAASGSIGPTPISTQVLSAGLYRISYYLVELQPATTSSSVAVTLSWTDRAVTRTQTSPALTGNSSAVAFTNSIIVRIDQGSALLYSVAYASVGATPMVYSLDIVIEQVLSLPS